jgi:hypothetical protein
MKRTIAVLLSVVVAVVSTGCATTGRSFSVGHARVDGSARAQEIPASYAGALPLGRSVEVRLKNGDKFKATFMGAEGDSIRVQRSGRLPVPPQLIPLDEVTGLRLAEGGGVSAGKALVLGIASGAATFFGLFILSIAAWAND